MPKDNNQEEYSFLEEQIKEEAPSKKKVLSFAFRIACAGILFGIAAGISFYAVKPWAENAFMKNPGQVEIPKDEEKSSEVSSEVKNEPEEPVKTTLDMESYQELSKALRKVVQQAKKSVVDIDVVSKNEEWMTEENGISDSTAGVIVADNGLELLILTNDTVLKQGEHFQITFSDNRQYEGTLKIHAGNIQMALISVRKSQLQKTTRSQVTVAPLGNSNNLYQGKTLIALGKPFGYKDGVGYGVASNVSHEVVLADGKYRIIRTDMVGNKNGSGVLFDTDGNVMGIIMPDVTGTGETSTLAAYGISGIKTEVELMSNSKEVPYIGIVGTFITKEISEAKNIPEGLYVREIEKKSPAMKAGIRTGDIITEIDGKAISTLTTYHNTLMVQEPKNKLAMKGFRIGTETYVEIDFTVTVGTKQ